MREPNLGYGLQLDTSCEDDLILPSQFFAAKQQGGERKLMLAVLKQAIHDLLSYSKSTDKRGRRKFNRAKAYILDSGKTQHLYSFRNICETFGRNPDKAAVTILKRIS